MTAAHPRRLKAAGIAGLVLPAILAAATPSPSPGPTALAAPPPAAFPAPPAAAWQALSKLPPYRAGQEVSGVVRLWGHGSPMHDFMGALVREWTAQFRRHQPGVAIENHLYGTASAIGALYAGAGNLALLGEEIDPAAAAAFRRERHYAPTRIEIATGSVDVNYFDYAQMIFVNRANPIDHLTLAQLDAIFGNDHRRGAGNLRTWGQLGLGGDWADRTIQPYAWRADEDFGLYFRARVLAGSHRWNPATREFVTFNAPGGAVHDRGTQILDALAHDRYGIAVSNIRFAGPEVKPVALAASDRGPFVPATPGTLISRSYPLVRIIPAYVDWPPGGCLDPAVREFLRFLLSREGQQTLVQHSGYLPLSAAADRAQRERLQAVPACRTSSRRDDGPLAAQSVRAGPPASGPPTPETPPVRIWGNPQLASLLHRWVQEFQRQVPGVRFSFHLTGSDTAMAGLYTGAAELALLGRAATDNEVKAFQWIHGTAPDCMPILRGSIDRPGRSPALALIVARDNPLSQTDPAALARLLAPEAGHAPLTAATWSALGLTGPWADRPLHVYVPDAESGTGRFLRERLAGGSDLLNWGVVRERGATDDNGALLQALRQDPDGLALTYLPRHSTSLKGVGWVAAEAADAPTARPATQPVGVDRYALGRRAYAYYSPVAGALPDDAARFLRYIGSPAAQRLIRPEDGYLPLTAAPGTGAAGGGNQGCRD